MASTSRKETWLATMRPLIASGSLPSTRRRSSTGEGDPRAARTERDDRRARRPRYRGANRHTIGAAHANISTSTSRRAAEAIRTLSGSGPRGADALRAAGRHRVPGVLNRRAHLGGRVHLRRSLHLHYHVSQPPRSVAAPCRSGAPGIDCRPPPHRAGEEVAAVEDRVDRRLTVHRAPIADTRASAAARPACRAVRCRRAAHRRRPIRRGEDLRVAAVPVAQFVADPAQCGTAGAPVSTRHRDAAH